MGKIVATSALKEGLDSVELVYVSGDDDYIIPVVYPDYKISVDGWKVSYLGHAGVLVIQGATGKAKYYEYGRYDEKNLGIVRSPSVLDVKMKEGAIIVSSLKKTLRGLSIKSGQSGGVSGAIFRKEKIYDQALNWLEDKKKKNVDPKRAPYTLYNNNCATFVDELLEYFDLASIVSSFGTPLQFIQAAQIRTRDLEYNFDDDTLEVDY